MTPIANWARDIAPSPETDALSEKSSRSELARYLTAGLLAVAFGPAGTLNALASPAVAVHQYAGVALSPDGTHVAAVETGPKHPVVVLRSAADGGVTATFDPCGTCAYVDPAWSPDGTSVTFVGWDATARVSRLWVAQGQTLRSSASFEGLFAKPRYSPDGKILSVLATLHPSKDADAFSPAAPQVGDLDALPPDVRRIAVLDGGSLSFRMASPADRFVYEYDWTPDGKAFVVTDAIGDPDNNWYVAKLELVELATGAARTLAAPTVQMNYPLVSPDGKSVFFIGGLMSDYGEAGGDIWNVPIAGGEPRNLTPAFKGSFNSLQRRAAQLYATALIFDHFTLFAMGKDGNLKPLWSDPMTVKAGDGRISLSADGSRLATTQQSFTIAPRVAAGRLNGLHPITHENDRLIANADVRSISYSNEGLTIQGWLLAPKNLQPGRIYPMAVYVHGGPAHFQEARFHPDDEFHDLLDLGYFIFVPNYRGGYGQGEAFTRANVMDLCGGDFRDIMAGVDAVEKIAPIDDKRLAIFGHSYGGYMTQWVVTQTQRFKAAAVSAGTSDVVSDYSLNGIPRWQDSYFNGTTPYDRQDVFDRISPLRFVKQVRTPTLLYGGEKDEESPIAWAIQFWHALKAMNVPTALTIYPGEGHKFSDPAHDEDVTARTVAWFNKYVGSGGH